MDRLRAIRAGAIICGIGLASSGSAAAAAEPSDAPAKVEVSANIGVVSDYRFRGISLSSRRPAIQGGVDVTTPAGFFAGVWASSIEEYAGADAEIDVYAGLARDVLGFDGSVGVYAYVYPGGSSVDYGEVQASLGRTAGPVTVTAQLAYAPDQKNTLSSNVYAGVGASLAVVGTPVTLTVRGGYEDGFFDSKWDWEARAAYEGSWGTASLAAVGTDHAGRDEAGRDGATGLLASVLLTF